MEHTFSSKVILFPRIPTTFRTPIIGMFIGAFLAAFLNKEFWPRKVKLKPALLSFFAGILVGFGTFLASGCTTRHLIIGIPALLADSWLSAVGIVGGIWIGTQFIKWMVGRE